MSNDSCMYMYVVNGVVMCCWVLVGSCGLMGMSMCS